MGNVPHPLLVYKKQICLSLLQNEMVSMLSRVANSVNWMCRYIERAKNVKYLATILTFCTLKTSTGCSGYGNLLRTIYVCKDIVSLNLDIKMENSLSPGL